MVSKPRVLIACEFSGVVREEFRKAGCDAWSCDLLPTEIEGQHIQDNVFNHLDKDWDLMIFHWPCTYLLNSGVRWFTTIPKKPKPGVLYGTPRLVEMECDANSFKLLLECGIPRICGENPTMCGQAQVIIEHEWTQHIQPYEFGHMEQKATFLWLKNLPPLEPTNNVYEEMMKLPKKEREKVHYASPGPERSKDRSRTYPGIARAMAEQWAPLLFDKSTPEKELCKAISENRSHVLIPQRPKEDE